MLPVYYISTIVLLTTLTDPVSGDATTSSNACPFNSVSATYFSQYNVITTGDFSSTSDVENQTIVCGSLKSNQANYCIHIDQNNFNAKSPCLEINGALPSGGGSPNVQVGSVSVGSNPVHTLTKKGTTQYQIDQLQFNLNGGNQGATAFVDSNLPSKCAAITSGLQTLSSSLFQITPNNNATIPSGQPSPLNLNVNNVDSNGIAIFNLSGSSVLANKYVQQIQININNANCKFILINLYGTAVNFNQGNLVGSWITNLNGRAKTLWNCPQATTMNLQQNLQGALLAPNAVVQASSNIDGATAVKSLTTQSELHNPPIQFPCLAAVEKAPVSTLSSTTPKATTTSTVAPTTTTSTTNFTYFILQKRMQNVHGSQSLIIVLYARERYRILSERLQCQRRRRPPLKPPLHQLLLQQQQRLLLLQV
ncbi:unnamed protein product [Didymodactylos carnosus]|uniref:Uncharacterized protein n=1 Tax=Didymodactylos carnosus TaxID=1234261 RepID=A0A814QP27_9BILA|nr:unnamed protein product [Didymodactylos carnosus]CAF3885846.1 unnamed protein product [Didymodactylos carnosus]